MQHVDIIYLALGGSMPPYKPYYALAHLEGGFRGLQPSFQISKIKERKNIEDNPLEKEEERKSCMFV